MTPKTASSPATHPALDGFHDATRAWFTRSFAAPTKAQQGAWPHITRGESVLVLAPTGSGKTLAAFLSAIDRLMFAPPDEQPQAPRERCRVLYVSPLKALAVDVDRNLRSPLVGVAAEAARLGASAYVPEIAIRTGDTPQKDRARFRRAPVDILITTPESLYLLLTSESRASLASVQTVIVDEVHAMVATKRGAHLALSLERLQEIAKGPIQRIGLSATMRPLDEAARFLAGFDDSGEPRPVRIVEAGHRKALQLRVVAPVEEMADAAEKEKDGIRSGPASRGLDVPDGVVPRSAMWAHVHPMLVEQIRAHRSTLIFVNSRRLAERLAGALNETAGEVLAYAHHGSIAREQRAVIEDRLKAGTLPCIVATSSLELGIDMGAIDLVVQVEAPPSVASGLQRIGRAGHTLDAPSTGVIIPKFRGDLLPCATLTARMRDGLVEEMRYPRHPLDVLAQHIVAMVSLDDWRVERLARVVRRAAPFAELPQTLLDGTLDMLSGRYPSDEFAELRPRLTWDRLAGTLHAREGARHVAITSAGTIPDRGLYGVFLLDAPSGKGRVGELDEEMVHESRAGETFVLGASTWRIEEITHDRVIVTPAPGEPGKMPFWKGDGPGRPPEFGRAIGALTRTLRAQPPREAADRLVTQHDLDRDAAATLLGYLKEQEAATGAVPDDRTIVIERYVDEMGDWRVCILTPFGGRVHAPWALAIATSFREQHEREIDMMWTDDGIVIRLPEAEDAPDPAWFVPSPAEVEDLVLRQLGTTSGGADGRGGDALFGAHFRENAARALLLPRRQPGRRAPLWQQRLRSAELLRVASRYGSFPIILETYRECLRDVFDMPALREILHAVEQRTIRVIHASTRVPSPFASAILFSYVGNFLYEGDAPVAERRAQALTVDPAHLRAILGDTELRELLDADVIDGHERELQHLTPERAARHADGVHDLLLRLGDLTREEIAARAVDVRWADELIARRRAVVVPVGGEERVIAVEDAARYRDALGVPLPTGLPATLLESVPDALDQLVSRALRTHGPSTPRDVAQRLGADPARVRRALDRLVEDGRAVRGEFRPGGHEPEWCDAQVLRTLRQRTLARLRRSVEPVDPPTFARFSLAWHGVTEAEHERASLLDAIALLEGAAIPASEVEARILPARLGRGSRADLDEAMASGVVMWVGAGSIGQRDGRVRLLLTEHAPFLLDASLAVRPDRAMHESIRTALAQNGASFFVQLHAIVGGVRSDVAEALWDLVWAGEVTNDTFQPVRARVERRSAHARRRWENAALNATRSRTWTLGPRGSLGTPRAVAPDLAGRWSLVRFSPADATQRVTALAQSLLHRHGVLTREAVRAEDVRGGFSAVYGVLRAMEDAGHARRGYFIAGQGAAQFALAGAVDRLRSHRAPADDAEAIVLAACDPANPYGAALPWPETAGARRPARAAGAIVVLVDGALAAWMGKADRHLLTFVDAIEWREPGAVRAAIAAALGREVETGLRGALYVENVDGARVEASPMAEALRAAGFVSSVRGLLKRI